MSLNAKDLNPVDAGLFCSLVGPPGSGKSHFARSAVALGPTFAFLAPPAEAFSYAGANVEYEVLADTLWRPSENSFKSEAYQVLTRELAKLEQRNDLKVLVFDTMNAGPSDAVWNWVMAGYGTDDPRTLGGNSRQPYVTYASRMTELMNRLDLFRFRKKCHVIVLWHEDIRESEGMGTPRKETEKQAGDFKTVLRWDVARLPMMRGSMRQDVAKWFDLAFYTEPVPFSNPFKCKLLYTPDQTRLAKSRLRIVQALQKAGELENNFPKLLQIVNDEYKKAGVGAK